MLRDLLVPGECCAGLSAARPISISSRVSPLPVVEIVSCRLVAVFLFLDSNLSLYGPDAAWDTGEAYKQKVYVSNVKISV